MKTALQRLALFALLVLAGCSARAFAENLPRKATEANKQGAAAQHLGGVAFQASDATFCALEAVGGGDNDLLQFPFGAQVVVGCSTAQTVCWTQGDSTDITISTATGLTDAAPSAPDGRGSCAPILAGTYRTMVLSRTAFIDPAAVGRRTGVCTTNGSASGATGRPCRQDSDCDAAGASETCLANQPNAITGAFLCASSADCSWVNEAE